MEKRRVKVSIVSTHEYESGESEDIRNEHEGVLEPLDDGTVIVVGDAVLDDSGETAVTTYRITDTKVKIVRSGKYGSVMVFGNGNAHHMDYRTPYGLMEMMLRTDELSVDNLDQGCPVVHIVYGMEQDGHEMSRVTLNMTISTVD